MNDILPKPFTKEGLLGMLEVRPSLPFSLLTHTISPETSHPFESHATNGRDPPRIRIHR